MPACSQNEADWQLSLKIKDITGDLVCYLSTLFKEYKLQWNKNVFLYIWLNQFERQTFADRVYAKSNRHGKTIPVLLKTESLFIHQIRPSFIRSFYSFIIPPIIHFLRIAT